MTATMRGKLRTADDALAYVRGGRGRMTVRSVKTGVRFTYKFSRPRHGNGRGITVGLLNCRDNESGYAYLGHLRERAGRVGYRHGRYSSVTERANSVKALVWTLGQLAKGRKPPTVEIWHEGTCGKCGRALTVPESIERGIGPVCAGKHGTRGGN